MLAVSAWGCCLAEHSESRGTPSDSNAGISAVTSTERAALVGEQQRVAGFIRRFADIMYAAMVGNASVSSIGVRGGGGAYTSGRGRLRVLLYAELYYCEFPTSKEVGADCATEHGVVCVSPVAR